MLVLKFGGTSVGSANAFKQTAKVISLNNSESILCVASAISGITDLNLKIIRHSAMRANQDCVAELFEVLKEKHYNICKELFDDRELEKNARAKLKALIDEFEVLTHGVSLLGECTPKTLDSGAAFGELLSTSILCDYLNSLGMNATLIDSRNFIATDSNFQSAKVDFQKTNKLIKENLLPRLINKKIIVAQGFIASDAKGFTTTLGRGGSDYSAAIYGSALNADEIMIYSDVDGILSSDPRIVEQVKILDYINAEQMQELALFGAKVLHPASIYPALKNGIKVRALNTFNIESKGTVIGANEIENNTEKVDSITIIKDVYKITGKFDDYSPKKFGKILINSILLTKNETSFTAIVKHKIGDSDENDDNFSLITINDSKIRNKIPKILSALSEIEVDSIFLGFSKYSLSISVNKDYAYDYLQFLHKNLVEN